MDGSCITDGSLHFPSYKTRAQEQDGGQYLSQGNRGLRKTSLSSDDEINFLYEAVEADESKFIDAAALHQKAFIVQVWVN